MKIRKLLVFVILIILLIKNSESFDCNATPKNTESRLKKSLICDYDKTVRPVPEHNKTTSIRMKYILKNFDFDQRGLTITLNSWMVMSWIDHNLKWTPKEYDNITTVGWQSDDLWMPDISVYNADIERGMDVCHKSNCLVNFDGRVSCVPPCSHTALCETDFQRWPFDRQNCTLHIGSWISSSLEIVYEVENLMVTSVHTYDHNQWKLISESIKHDHGKIVCCPNRTYPNLKLNFIIERHSAMHSAVILAPALIMIAINLIALWLEPGCSERLSLYGLNLLSHFFFIQQVSWYVPTNGSQCPNVVIFFRDTLVITAILLLNTVITRSIARFQSIAPYWIDITTNTISNNIVGKYFLSSNLNEYKCNDEGNDEESLTTDSNPINNIKTNPTWKLFAKLIDRILFIIILITYIIMLFTLVPESYEKISNLEQSSELKNV